MYKIDPNHISHGQGREYNMKNTRHILSDSPPIQEAFPNTPEYPDYTTYNQYKTQHPTQNSSTCPAHPGLSEDLILIKYELGIKEKQNGERDKQIQHAWNRINTVGNRAEEEDTTLNTQFQVMKVEIEFMRKLQWAILGCLLALFGTIIFFFIEFNWKTFILGF